MAVSILTSSSHVQSLFDTSITQSINTGTTGSDRVLVIGLSFDSDGSGGKADNAQYNTDAMTFIGRILPVNGTNGGVELWYLVNPDTGANNFTADFINDTTGNPQEVAGVHIQHWTLQDAAQTGQPDVSGTDNSTDNTCSVALTTTEADTILLGIACGLKGGAFASWAPQGGATEDSDTSVPDFTISTGLHRAQATATATSLATDGNSDNGNNYVMVAAAFKSVADTTVAVDLASETDTALDITPAKTVQVDQALETDTALDVQPAIAVAVDQVTETDTALAITPAKAVAVDLAVETDVALGITPAKAVAIDIAIETDAALAIVPSKVVAVDQVIETDTAFDVQPAKRVAVDIAAETNIALALVTPIIVEVDIAIETDSALDLILGLQEPTVILSGQAVETVQISGSADEIPQLTGSADEISLLTGTANESSRLAGIAGGIVTLKGSLN